MARRRFQVTGHLDRRGDKWLLQWWAYYQNAEGRDVPTRESKVIGLAEGKGALTEKQARREASQYVLRRVDECNRNPRSQITVQEYVTNRFEPQHIWSLQPRGKEHYELILRRHVLPDLGSKRMRDVNRLMVQSLIRAKMDGASLGTQTARHIRNVIGRVFREAQMDGFFDGPLPTQGVKIPVRMGRPRMPLSLIDARRLIWSLASPYREMAFALATTGLRIGELCGLRWRDVDPVRGYLRVVNGYNPRFGYWPAKSDSSGDVPLPRLVAGILAGLRGVAAADAPVFAGRTGKPVDAHNALNRHIRPAAKRLGLDACWHTLRHTLATASKDMGARAEDRMAVLRHQSPEMARRYAHGDPEAMRAIMDQIAGELSGDAEVQGRVM